MDNTNPNQDDQHRDLNELITPPANDTANNGLTGADVSEQPAPAAPTMSPQTPKSTRSTSRRKRLFVALAVIVLVGGAAAVWFMTKGAQKAEAPAANDQATVADQTDDKTNLRPTSVAYAFGDAGVRDVDLFLRPIAGGDRRSAGTFPKNNHLAGYGVHKNKAFYVTTPELGGDKLTIYYSNDAGKTYDTVFEGAGLTPNSMGDQITSVRFSTDGSRIVFGFLANNADTAQVKELDPETKQVKDLFNEDQRGVFVHAYDVAQKKIIYSTGCYNCDGNTNNRVYQRIDASDKQLLYEHDGIGDTIIVKHDLTKILVTKSADGGALGGSAPYMVDEFDVASKSFKSILPSGNEYPRALGYSEEGLPYFAVGTKVTQVTADNKQSVLFEGSKPIYEVLFVGLDQVVASVGDISDFELVNFNSKDKKLTSILSGDNVTYLFGVTWD